MERGERKKSAVSPGGFATPLGNGYNNCSGRQWCWTRRQAAQPKRSLWNTALNTRQTPICPFQDTWTIHLNGSRPGHRRNLDKLESMDIQQTIFSNQNAAPLGRPCGTAETNLSIPKTRLWSLAWLSESRIRGGRELWCGAQMQLRHRVAGAEA